MLASILGAPMIENYAAKKKAGRIQLEFAEGGNIGVFERKFDEDDARPVLKHVADTNVKHIQDLISDEERRLEPIMARIADLKALLPDVKKKEKEGLDLTTRKAKRK